MNSINRLDIPPRITSALKKAKLTDKNTVLCMSAADLERATKLSPYDVGILLKATSYALPLPCMETAQSMYYNQGQGSYRNQRLSTGCPILDDFLRGGILSHGITEVTGVSSSGKTQLCLQLCLSVQLPWQLGGLDGGAVYVSTEDVFPSKRLHQLIQHFMINQEPFVASKLNLGDNIFIEHAADVDDLRKIIAHRLPLLLNRGAIRLVIVDSITALFRVEYSRGETTKRAKVLWSFGAQLHKLSCQYNIPVVCVNQVSDVIKPNSASSFQGEKSVIPALGMAWSSMVTVRLILSRTEELIQLNNNKDVRGPIVKRLLKVLFAPHLPNENCSFFVDSEGVHGIQSS